MGATIYYRQLTPKDRQELDVDAPSSFMEAMRKVFGDNHVWRLTAEDIPVLKGMSAVYDGVSQHPFGDLIEAIEKLDAIEVWPEW